MEPASGLQLKELVIRAALYVLGLVIILALILAVIFAAAKPQLLNLAKGEMGKYGIEAQNVDMSLFGTVHMRNIAVPLHNGGLVRIDEVSARPPLRFFGHTWLGSNGILYNLRLEKGGASLFIPELRFSGLSINEKDPAIASRSLQMLKRLQASRIYADKIQLAVKPSIAADGASAPAAAKLETVINGFGLNGLNRGEIARLSYNSMDSNAALPAHKQGEALPGESSGDSGAKGDKQSALHSGAFLAENLDAASLYALAKSLLPPEAEGKQAAEIPFPAGARGLIGKIRLRDVSLIAEDEKFGSVRLAVGELGSNGLALKGKKSAADFITQLAAAGPEGAGSEKKQIIVHNMRQILADIASIDIETQNVQVEIIPKNDDLADNAANEAQKPALAQPPKPEAGAEQKTVSDILDEEQGEKQEQRGQWKKDITHLPLHFKLALSSFVLTADHWGQAIPYGFYIKVKDLSYIPGKTRNGLIRTLQDMGHKDLQFSLLGDMGWNAADSSLNIRHLAFYGRDMGGFEVQGKFLDIPKSFFDGKADSMAVILNEAAIANMEIRLKDSGFIKSLVQWGTEQMNISAKELQDDLYDIAVKSPPLLLKNRQEAQNFSDVFGAFVKGSGSARITLTAPQPNGLKWNDIMSAQDDLSVLLDKLKLTADRPETDVLIE